MPGDLAHATTTGSKNGDLFSLNEREIAPRLGTKIEGWHATTFAKPAHPDSGGHTRCHGGLLARQTSSDLFPEPLPMLAASHRRTAW